MFEDAGNVTRWRVSYGKTATSHAVPAEELRDWQFIGGLKALCPWLVIDLDRPTGVLDAYQMTSDLGIRPAWVIETHGGRAQLGIRIDPVNMRATTWERGGAQRYVRAVGHELRRALGGDVSVDPVCPIKFRNPLWRHADVHVHPNAPVYRLGDLEAALRAAGAWAPPRLVLGGGKAAEALNVPTDTDGVILQGERNQTIFDATRFAAYRGAPFEAIAWETAERCEPPLQPSEVRAIIASVARFVGRPVEGQRTTRTTTASTPMPEGMHEVLSEMGRRGGRAGTAAQRAARMAGTPAASAARTARGAQRAERIRQMTAEGLSAAQIATRLGCSESTVRRARRGGVTTGASGQSPSGEGTAPGGAQGPRPGEWELLEDVEGRFWDEVAVLAEGAEGLGAPRAPEARALSGVRGARAHLERRGAG